MGTATCAACLAGTALSKDEVGTGEPGEGESELARYFYEEPSPDRVICPKCGTRAVSGERDWGKILTQHFVSALIGMNPGYADYRHPNVCWKCGYRWRDQIVFGYRLRLGWGFWPKWVVANTIGWPVGSVAGVAVGLAVGLAMAKVAGMVAGEVIGLLVALVVLGALVGAAQWLVLRWHVSQARRWLLATIVGWACFGITQWLVLRREFARASGWLAASIVVSPAVMFVGLLVAGGAAEYVGWVVGGSEAANPTSLAFLMLLGPIFALLAGALYGAVTGIALRWVLRQPKPRS